MIDLGEREEFECPDCGSSCFGTMNPLDPADLRIRQCHGEGYSPCGFSWPVQDDWKYFVVLHKMKFESQEEYASDAASE